MSRYEQRIEEISSRWMYAFSDRMASTGKVSEYMIAHLGSPASIAGLIDTLLEDIKELEEELAKCQLR